MKPKWGIIDMTQKNEIIEWVSRGNTNPAVLGSMLDNYTVPSTMNTINVVNNADNAITIMGLYGVMGANNNSVLQPESGYIDPVGQIDIFPNNSASRSIICADTSGTPRYKIAFGFEQAQENYIMTVNGTPAPYTEGMTSYAVTSDTPIIGQTYNVVIADKE